MGGEGSEPGAPVRRAKVRLFSRGQALQVKKKGNAVSRRSFADLSKAPCDKQGAFQVEHSHDGDFVLIASARGYADALLELPTYEAAKGEGGVAFAMNKGGEVKGTVLDAFGEPVPRAYLVLNHELHKLHRKRAGRDGSFHFRGIPEGRWMLSVVEEFDSGFYSSTIDVEEDWRFPTNCTVVADKTTSFDLHLPDPSGTWIRGGWHDAGERGEGWTATISTLSAGLLGGDPFVDRWSDEQPLTPGEAFEIPVQPGRGYHLRLTHASVPGMLSREVPAADLPAQVTLPSEFTTFRAHPRASITNTADADALIVEWKQSGWSYRARLRPNEDGTFGPTLVPTGSLNLLWKVPGGDEIVDMLVEAKPSQILDAEL